MNVCNTTKLLKVYERKTWVLVLITVPLAAIKKMFSSFIETGIAFVGMN